ncbi:MAG: metallophosphoesterase family protein [Oscillospiraceae bacterium]|jgi:predicted phosphodiesterase|nr:metallophosphoesterase family protein [Oscillospiraceae bacterium]
MEKIALISDVHGNLPALKAVIADAEKRGAARFLLLGDYVTDFPFPNGIAELLKGLENATIIRGNKEERYERLRAEPELLSREQMAAARWDLSELSGENADYLFSLPGTAELEFGGQRLFATHSVRELCRKAARLSEAHSSWYRRTQAERPFARSEYIGKLTAAIDASPEVSRGLDELPRGIYAFGHNHLQAHYRRGGSLFVNPGSCGLPLDFEPTAPYTILTARDGEIRVEEIRVEYDIAATVAAAMRSDMYEAAPVWCDIHARVLETGEDFISAFLDHAYDLAHLQGREEIVSNEVWRKAWETWELR